MDSSAPQVVQPGLEVMEQRAKMDPYVNSYGPEVHSHPPPGIPSRTQPRRNPFGLSPLVFGLLVGAVTAIVMGAALGGGIGGALASCLSQKSELEASQLPTSSATQSAGAISSALTSGFSSIQTSRASLPTAISSGASASAIATATNYAPVSIRDVKTLAIDCPAIDGTTIKNHFNQDFTYTCGIDLGNLPAAEGGNITDIASIIAYTVEDCIDACSGINFQTFIQGIDGGPSCSSVSWMSNGAASVTVGNGNCWLKKGTLAQGQTGNRAQGAVTAQLV